MASCQTSQWGNSSPYVKLTVTQSSSTETTATLSWTLQYIASSAASTSVAKAYTVKIAGATVKEGTYSINGKTGTYTIASGTYEVAKGTSAKSVAFSVSFAFNLTWSGTYKGTLSASGSISVAAKTSYTIKYNANGGSGAPSSQSKWHGTNITLSNTTPTRSGYTFKGWGTSSTTTTVSYAAGATYSSNASTTLYAIWTANTYAVKYNANGGSGAPSNQTKTHGVTLTLSSTKPTKSGYTFKGWGTSASSTTVSYAAGASYTQNAAITLYAIWSQSYKKPVITNFSVARCNSSGTLTDEGKYALVKFKWSTDLTGGSIYINWKTTAATSWNQTTATKSGTSGTVSQVVGSGALSLDSAYIIKITVSDTTGSTVASSTLGGSAFPMELLAEDAGVHFGKAVQGNVLGLSALPTLPTSTNFNDMTTPGVWCVKQNADAATMSNIPIAQAGRLIVANSTGWDDPSSNYRYLLQTYVPYLTTYPTYERHIRTDANSTWIYSAWKCKTLPTKDITLTMETGVTYKRYYITRHGDIVTMFFAGTYNTTKTGPFTIAVGQIGSDYPGGSVSNAGAQGNSMIVAWVTSGGVINVRFTENYTANSQFEFTLTWNVGGTWTVA